ncbi:MAG: GxxExxY protein [Janthinobacterium lividum]
MIEDQVLVELKAITEITAAHHAQLINYLKAYRLEVALLVNLGEPSLKFKRFLHNPTHYALPTS